MNATVIDEDAGSEILKILELKKSSLNTYEKGIGRFIEREIDFWNISLHKKTAVLELFASKS